jgi:hypothetical protein
MIMATSYTVEELETKIMQELQALADSAAQVANPDASAPEFWDETPEVKALRRLSEFLNGLITNSSFVDDLDPEDFDEEE